MASNLEPRGCADDGCSCFTNQCDSNLNNNNGQNVRQFQNHPPSAAVQPNNVSLLYRPTQTYPQNAEDKMLARELNELTFQEREKIFDEVHGIVEIKEETPEYMATCLQNLQTEIAKLPRGKRKLLDRAFFLKPALQYDEKFLKMFLRSDNYDACRAAHRMATYFTNKTELFGEDKLVKDITLEDMDEDDMEGIKTGSVHILPEKDRAGRTILFINGNHHIYKSWKNLTRYIWYQIMVGLENESTQIRGLVDIMFNIGQSEINMQEAEFLQRACPIMGYLPFRMSAFHCCYDNPRFKPALSLVQMLCTRYMRLRFRVHYGSGVECLYALMTFGIPRQVMPIHPDGTPDLERNEQYLAERRTIEAERKRLMLERQKIQAETDKLYDTPGPNDVLLGRGKPFQEYCGNLQLMALVDAERTKYQSLDHFAKPIFTMGIVKKVQEIGGRFLTKTEKGWKEVDDTTARDKVSHAFRTKPTKTNKNNNQGKETDGLDKKLSKDEINRSPKRLRHDK